MAVRAQVVVRGIVQGVGFRPFVYRLAREHGLGGWVLNSTQGVVIEVEGERERIDGFLGELQAAPPPQALIEKVATRPTATRSSTAPTADLASPSSAISPTIGRRPPCASSPCAPAATASTTTPLTAASTPSPTPAPSAGRESRWPSTARGRRGHPT